MRTDMHANISREGTRERGAQWASLVAQLVKNPPAMQESAYNTGGLGSVPGLGRSPGGGNSTHSSILAWEIPWTEDSGGLQSMESQELDTT